MKEYDVVKHGWRPRNFREALYFIVGDSIGKNFTLKKFEEVKKTHAELLTDILNIKKDFVVLDLGCGVAEIARHISKKCKRVYAADVSKEMLEYAERRVKEKNIFLVPINGTNLGCFKEDFFDAGYASALFFHLHLHEIYNYFRELKRVLKPRAPFYFEIFDLLDDNAFKRFEMDCKKFEYKNNPYGCLKYIDKAIIERMARRLRLDITVLGRSKEGVLSFKIAKPIAFLRPWS